VIRKELPNICSNGKITFCIPVGERFDASLSIRFIIEVTSMSLARKLCRRIDLSPLLLVVTEIYLINLEHVIALNRKAKINPQSVAEKGMSYD
jgi:hypothetical protein